MPTLQELRKAKFQTIKAFAEAWGRSPSTASSLLNGRYHYVLSKDDVQRMADLFGVSFDECIDAANAAYNEWCTKKANYVPKDGYWDLRTRWQREERWQEEAKRWQARGGRDRIFFALETVDAFLPLGLSSTATKDDVMRAFRAKVKAMADGKGGYTGDMDALVQAKEKALHYIGSRA